MRHAQFSAASGLRLSPLAACLGAVLALGAVAPCASASSVQPAAAWPFQRHAAGTDLLPVGLRLLAAESSASRHDAPAPHGGVLLPVTSCADDGSAGTLRHVALIASTGDTIDLSGLTCSTITLESGAVNIDVDDITVMGPGSNALAIDGNGADRVFHHGGTGTLTLAYLTVTNGRYTALLTGAYGGGCVYSKGSISLTGAVVSSCTAIGDAEIVAGGLLARESIVMVDSTVKDNQAIALTGTAGNAGIGGGAVAVYEVTLEHSTVSGNSITTPFGKVYVGGVFGARGLIAKYSTLTGNSATTTNVPGSGYYAIGGALAATAPIIENCTIDNNSADAGAGMYLLATDPGYSALIRNSTISSNHAALVAGGIFSIGDIRLENSTVAFNVAGSAKGGGGAIVDGTNTELESTIIADNSPSGASAAADFDGSSIVTGANNLIKISGALITVPPDTITDDPQLGPLAANGGETRTHAIGATSPAFDAGNNSASQLYDQRGPGFARVVGAAADIGAYELDPDIIFVDGFDVGG